MKIKRNKEISIVRLNGRGNGEGYYDADELKVEVEVPFTCEGDRVIAELASKKKGIRQGHLLEIISPSPHRIAPRCIHFAVCGGCRLQHISYEDQLAFKEALVAKLFSPFVDSSLISPILPSPSLWNYRNKMEFTFSQNKAGEQFLGLMMAKGRVLNLQECHLVNSWFVEALNVVREWWKSTSLFAYNPYKDTGSLRTLTLREGLSSGDRFVILTVSGNPDYALHKKDIHSLVEALNSRIAPSAPESRISISLRIHQAIKGQPTQFFDMHLSGPDFLREALKVGSKTLDFHISPSAFFQPNPRQAEKLFHHAVEMAQIPSDGVVYDLFCGTGTLGICIAPRVKQVIGIELVPEAVYDARANAAANGLDNVTFLAGDVYTLLQEIIETSRFPAPDAVFVDPPRAGLGDKAIAALLKILPPTLVYISCNPQTQAKDIELLLEKYRIAAIQPVDQFPHTPHIENIVLLVRR